MRLLAHFDLTDADRELFLAYEAAVLPFLADHGGRMERRLRSLDGSLEVHLLHFATPEGVQAYLNDPRRGDSTDLWLRSGAKATVIQVEDIA